MGIAIAIVIALVFMIWNTLLSRFVKVNLKIV